MDSPGFSLNIDSFDLPVLDDQSEGTSLQKKRDHERPTECSICGKRAHGHHYDVPSCNGCKIFFRRTWISEKNFNCKANGDCFDLTMRAAPIKCRACRYQKCLAVGMKPEALQRKQNASNKMIKREIRENEDFDDVVARQKKTVIRELDSMENKMQRAVDTLTYLESKLEIFRMSAYNIDCHKITALEELLNNGTNLGMGDKLGPMPGWPLANFPPLPLFENCLRSSGPAHFATLIGLMELLERQQRMQKDMYLLRIAPFAAKGPRETRILVIEEIMNN